MKMLNLWRITILGIVLVVIVFVWIFLLGVSSNQPGSFYNTGHNAVWIGHEWVGQDKTESEVQQLVQTLQANQIDTVFVHVGPIETDGNVSPERYKYSLGFVEKAKRFDENIKYQAWLGQLRYKIDLEDPNIRHNITNLCLTLSQVIEFDGIHFDIEPVWDGDGAFIQLLEETREVLSDEKLISVALAEFIPSSVIWFTENVHQFENYSSEVNYENVAAHADQIVVMAYDTSIDYGWLYRWLVKEQTIRVTDLLPNTEVFIGIPAYEDVKIGFNPEVENIENGLKGIIDGLNNFRSNEDSFAGVAIYSYWTIDESEWDVYNDLWLD